MGIDNGVLIGVESMEKIIKELDEISVLCFDTQLKTKVEGLQSFVSSLLKLESKSSVENIIF